jgi:UDP-2,3-diacylglucosamine hydrolase
MKTDCLIKRLSYIELKQSAPILFVSDLHLSESLPRTCAAFCQFLNNAALKAQALFILGDLFEYWIGDDCLDDTHSVAYAITQSLAQLKQRGVDLFILCGNRDFLLGQQFAEQAHALLVDDICLLTAFEKKIVLAHGDTLCTDDHSYQTYRSLVHRPWLQNIFLAMPFTWRQKIAQCLRQRSQKPYSTAHPLAAKKDVNDQAVQQLLDQYHSSILIHGHTHRPQCHTYDQAIRWVLSDWDLDHAQRASYLCLDSSGLYAVDNADF